MTKKADNVTYLLMMKDGSEKRIEIPKKWKVTFGLTAPGSKNGNYNSGLALRLYEGSTQRAVFTDVESFRDTSIPIQEKRITQNIKEGFVGEGNDQQAVKVVASTSEWVNPDSSESGKPSGAFVSGAAQLTHMVADATAKATRKI